MEELLLKTFDFAIRIVELSNYLEEEGKRFALMHRLLECGTEIGICMRISARLPGYSVESFLRAYRLASEAEFMLELTVKTGVITENQSKPILSDCRFIKEQIEDRIGKEPDKQPIRNKEELKWENA